MLQPRTFNQIAKVHIDNKIRKLYCHVLITLNSYGILIFTHSSNYLSFYRTECVKYHENFKLSGISQNRENGLGLSKNLFGLLNSK
jgi:hypothetical protein